MADSIEIRAYRPGDEHGLLQGYNQSFPTPRSLAHWNWKFRDNPTGQVQIIVADHEQDGIVGCYAMLPVRVQMEGQEQIAAQGLDMWVLPQYRMHGPRPGLFVHLGNKNYELFTGPGEGQCRFQYGWAVPNWRIGQRYLRYENIRDWDFLFRVVPPGGLPARPSSDALVVQKVERFAADVDALWARLKDESQLAIVRDQRYLNWRYADAHDAVYDLYECRERSGGALRGVMAYRRTEFLFPDSAKIVDWLCPVDDDDTMVALVAQAERRASETGASVLATMFPQMNPRFLKFQDLGYRVFGTEYFLVVVPCDRHTMRFYREHWFHTLGDSDLL